VKGLAYEAFYIEEKGKSMNAENFDERIVGA
jgi:hypothetical protein